MTVINLPIDYTQVDLAQDGLVWKQIIPLDKEIVYGGEKLKFTRDILDDIVSSYDAKVVNQTAFQLADDQNRHDTDEDVARVRNFDPQRYRGDVQELRVTPEGLVGGFKLTDDGIELIKKNPKLGVSAGIKKNYVGEDGKVHKYVLRHVVGTLDPKIKHMSPWQGEGITLTAADDPNEEVYDLTTAEAAPASADTQSPPAEHNANTVTISREEYDNMKSTLAEFNNGEELLNQILAEEDAGDDGETQLSQDPRITELQNRAAASEWRAARAEYTKDGVPTAMLNLCDDVMSVYESPMINLSDGGTADPRDVIHSLLHEARGTVDLSSEMGHGEGSDAHKSSDEVGREYVNGFVNKFNLGLFG